MKAYNSNRQPLDSRRVKHIHANRNEWVCVHRTYPVTPPTSSSIDWLWPLVAKIGGAIILFVIVCKVLEALLPFLVLAAIGWFYLVRRK
jgi:hypothetical protein